MLATSVRFTVFGFTGFLCFVASQVAPAQPPEKDVKRIVAAEEAQALVEQAIAKGWTHDGWGDIWVHAKGLTLEAAQILGNHKGMLSLQLDEMPDDVAKALSRHEGDLIIQLSEEPSKAASDAFHGHKGDMSLQTPSGKSLASSSFRFPFDPPARPDRKEDESDTGERPGEAIIETVWLPQTRDYPRYRKYALKAYKSVVDEGVDVPDSQIYTTINMACMHAEKLKLTDEQLLQSATEAVASAQQLGALANKGLEIHVVDLGMRLIREAARRDRESRQPKRKVFDGIE